MLRYKILKSTNDHEIGISLNTSDIDKKNMIDLDDVDSYINSGINVEKESYKPVIPYALNFNFYKDGYNRVYANAGFDLSVDLKKNIFKKSFFLLEFYESNISKTRKFSTTLSIYPNPKSKKGSDELFNLPISKFTVNDPLNELFYIYFNRTFTNLSNINILNGVRYVSLYVKIMFLNAKTGKVQYFIPSSTTTILNSGDFNDSLYYMEIRFFENYSYAFYSNGIIQDNIYFKELVVV